MWQLFLKFVRAPTLENPQDAARARLLHVALWITAIGSIPITIVNFQSSPKFGLFVLLVGGLSLLGLGLNHAGRTRPAAGFLIALIYAATVYTLIDGRGLYDSGILAPPIIIILSTFYFGRGGGLASVVAWIVTLLALSVAGVNGFLPGSGLDRPVPVTQMIVIDVLLTAIGGLIWVILTVWERTLADLSESKSRLELALHSADMEAWTWDIRRDRIYVGESVFRALGLPGDTRYTFAKWLDRLHPEDRQSVEAGVNAYLAGQGDSWSSEYRVRTEDGRWLWRMVAGRIAETNDHGEPVLLTGVALDLTDIRETHLALLNSERRYRLLTQELHDSVTQTIYSMTLTLKAARKLLEQDPARVPELLGQLEALSADALGEMREMLRQARPEVLDERGLTAAIAEHLAALKERYGLEVEFDTHGNGSLSPEAELALYRVAQEALTNIIKHAEVQHARVRLDVGMSGATLHITDEGTGFDTAEGMPERGGYGLENMRQRIESMGGSFRLTSVTGKGTTIVAEIPSPQAGASAHA